MLTFHFTGIFCQETLPFIIQRILYNFLYFEGIPLLIGDVISFHYRISMILLSLFLLDIW